jgi:threonine/homoserine/homoserine lactone efflux protein
MIRSGVILGIIVCALSSMNVVFMVLYGVETLAVAAAVIGYLAGVYLLYYGFFGKDEPSLKDRMKEARYQAEKKAEESRG